MTTEISSINNLLFENNPIFLLTKEQININSASDFYMRGKDVASILGYKNTRDAILRHVSSEDKLLIRNNNLVDKSIITLNNSGEVFINESGLYSLIMCSELSSAKRFKHWVTSEVLPKIRKTGSYAVQQTPIIDEDKIRLIVKNIALENMLELNIDKVELNIKFLRAYGLTKAKASELTFKAMKYKLDIKQVLEDYLLECDKMKQSEYDGKIKLAIAELVKLGYTQKDAWNTFAELASKATGKDLKAMRNNARVANVQATYCTLVRDHHIQKQALTAINKFIALEKKKILKSKAS